MLVKVCGMRELANVAEVAALHPDFMGFIYYPKSPRHFGDMAPEVVSGLPSDVMPVLVTVDMPVDQLRSLISRYGFRGVQLHGSESPDVCRALRQSGMYVIKAISVNGGESINDLGGYKDAADLLVLDTATAARGGSGQKFDWTILDGVTFPCDFLLSGGIGSDDAEAVAGLQHPQFAGVDVNSRFEDTPGVKSLPKLQSFMQSIKGYE